MSWLDRCPNCGETVKFWSVGSSPTNEHASSRNGGREKCARARAKADRMAILGFRQSTGSDLKGRAPR